MQNILIFDEIRKLFSLLELNIKALLCNHSNKKIIENIIGSR